MKIIVAIAQFSAAVLDLKASVEKAYKIIESAGKRKAKVLAFPQTWIPVYPLWSDMGSYSQWGNEAAKRLYRRLHENSIARRALLPSRPV